MQGGGEDWIGNINPRRYLCQNPFLLWNSCEKHIGAKVGVVDTDCRGDWGVILFNHVDQFDVQKGDRITQLILGKIATNVVEKVQQLDSTNPNRPPMTRIRDFGDPKSWGFRMQGTFKVCRNQNFGWWGCLMVCGIGSLLEEFLCF